MKLISLYVENFGSLHRYSLSFSDGLTVLEEENGFGKSTLAEFIRAMFYGFPRAVKKLEKNPRKKYLPWQGGKFGGNLVFENNGKRYRIERTFGETPRTDTFVLTDALTQEKSRDYSENIGLELFQVDSDSFERSTYMPQLWDGTDLSTVSIQAKLGNLVEDTNDINRYDKALEALKKKRSSLVPFKGSSGSVFEAGQHISRLQLDIEDAECQRQSLDRIRSLLEDTRRDQSAAAAELETVREEITLASQYAARSAAVQRYGHLCRSLDASLEATRALSEKYPQGLPSLEALDALEPTALQLAALDRDTPRLSPDITRLLQDARFADGIPEASVLEGLRQDLRSYTEAQAERRRLALSPEDAAQLRQLEALFASGVPEEDFFTQCQSLLQNRATLEERHRTASLDPGDREQLRELEAFFGGTVPEESDLESHREKLNRATALRQENIRLSAVAVPQTPAEPAPVKKKTGLLPALGGLVSVLVGIVLLLLQQIPLGAALMGVGLLLFAAFFLVRQKELERKILAAQSGAPDLSAAQREAIARNERTAAALEQEVYSLVSSYPCTQRSLSDKLTQLQTGAEALLRLRRKLSALEEQKTTLRSQTAELDAALEQRLTPYLNNGSCTQEALLLLRDKAATCRRLQKAQSLGLERINALAPVEEAARQRLTDYLTPYFGNPDPADFDRLLTRLEQESAAYANARKQQQAHRQLVADRERERQQCREALYTLAQTYGLQIDLADWVQRNTLRDDMKQAAEAVRQEALARQALDAFLEEQGGVPEPLPSVDLRPMDVLSQQEQDLIQVLTRHREQLVSLEQQQRLLLEKTDRIPELRDQLEQWKLQRETDLKHCALLDETVRFLQEAKTALSNSYLGTVQQKFTQYMARVSGEDPETLFVSPQLSVSLDRLGQARPLACFSAGQTDLVMLCMRLALVDALFPETRPFVILDDPFVNLDDKHLSQALALLQDLSQNRQILYLYCNTSRRPS